MAHVSEEAAVVDMVLVCVCNLLLAWDPVIISLIDGNFLMVMSEFVIVWLRFVLVVRIMRRAADIGSKEMERSLKNETGESCAGNFEPRFCALRNPDESLPACSRKLAGHHHRQQNQQNCANA